jgi:hypothetical protein
MKNLLLFILLPNLLISKENFEHKQQLMIESHIYAIDQISNDLWGIIPYEIHYELIYHIESLKVLTFD